MNPPHDYLPGEEGFLEQAMSRPMFYRRDGTPYPGRRTGPTLAWARESACFGTRRVEESYTAYGEWLSTVWLGLDHAFLFGPPLIFETAVFVQHPWTGETITTSILGRYSTEREAWRGHHLWELRLLIPPLLRPREWRG